MIHALKIEKQYFEAVASGRKTFEVRNNDRNFMVGDFLALNEVTIDRKTYTDKKDNEHKGHSTVYTGRCCLVEVDYILDSEEYLQPGFVALAIKPCAISRSMNDYRYTHDIFAVPTYEAVAVKEEAK